MGGEDSWEGEGERRVSGAFQVVPLWPEQAAVSPQRLVLLTEGCVSRGSGRLASSLFLTEPEVRAPLFRAFFQS